MGHCGLDIDFSMASCSCCASDIDLFVFVSTISNCPTLDEILTAALELNADDVALALSVTSTLGSLL